MVKFTVTAAQRRHFLSYLIFSTASGKRKRNASGPSSSQATHGRRGNKTRRVDNGEGSADAVVPFDDEDENDDEINALTPQEVTRIKSAVLGTLMVRINKALTIHSLAYRTRLACQSFISTKV